MFYRKEKAKLFSDEAQNRLDTQRFVHSVSAKPISMVFASLKPVVAVADASGNVTLLNWESAQPVDWFENSTDKERIHSPGEMPTNGQEEVCWLEVINPLTHGYLATGTKDGTVRVWDLGGHFVEVRD